MKQVYWFSFGILLLVVVAQGTFGNPDSDVGITQVSDHSALVRVIPEYAESFFTPYNTSQDVTLTFVGDMMFDRYIRTTIAKNSPSHPFGLVRSKLKETDGVIGNLEGTITNNPAVSKAGALNDPNHYRFTFDPSITSALLDANFVATYLGNNHIYDFGADGLQQTLANLDIAGIPYFGQPFHSDASTTIEINGKTFGLVGYNQFVDRDRFQTMSEISALKKDVDFVIVMTHWGNEYEVVPTTAQRELAHDFINVGAHVIFGSHPHVIQSKEIYKGKTIYYSLGNFIFDQYFQSDVRCGAVIEATFSNEGITFEESFSYLEVNGQTLPSECMSEVPKIEIDSTTSLW